MALCLEALRARRVGPDGQIVYATQNMVTSLNLMQRFDEVAPISPMAVESTSGGLPAWVSGGAWAP
jgi:hypothetical protein